MAVSGLTWTCFAYVVPISLRRSAGGGSKTQSAWLFSTAVTAASTVSPKLSVMVSE